MSLEPSSTAPAGEVGAGYWAAREEAAARLEAMAAAACVDDDLSEGLFQGNSQIQEDEISLHYQLQGDIQVYMNVGANETTDTGDEGDDEDADDGLLYACSLQHLPPITLTCLLPRSYPRPLLRGRGEVAGRAGVHGVLLRHPREGRQRDPAGVPGHVVPRPAAAARAAAPPRRRGLRGYARWESLALRRTLDTMPDVAYCPRCNAACVAAGDDAQCPACFFTFCAQCGERRHVGDDCIPAEDKLDELLERQKLKSSAREEQRLREQRKVEEPLSLREVLRSTRQCPSCRMAIAKTEGCNKMVCHNCGKFFCYRCSRAISGYAHFVKGECGLFERVGRGRLPGQQARMDNQDLDEDVEIKEPGWMRALRYTCPTCGAKRTKAGANNLLVCRACQTRYCALCWKRVWEVSQHYGPWGDCQQRS
ncbi:hypothetical protein C2845_PM12G24000 [Panicum miliaceum]|uniref:RING-type domain-containing protein n=1 Tax=Panicum miliaceum TaxID=4540 RepID=A0A3L6QIV0_PANMI|nr:hypothetical protein C2845_PM12G24000 [Panicum miliaceum]